MLSMRLYTGFGQASACPLPGAPSRLWAFLNGSGFCGDRVQGKRSPVGSSLMFLFTLSPFTSFSTLAFRLASPQSWLNPIVYNILGLLFAFLLIQMLHVLWKH